MNTNHMTAVKIVKVLGTSSESWQDAAQKAVSEASKTIDNISGIEIHDHTAKVKDGSIIEYRATVEVAFPVREESR